MQLFGIGITYTIKNDFTIFFSKNQFVFTMRKYKIKMFWYKTTCSKPLLKSFFGLTIGDLNINALEQK